eukprot:TRINITY_DN1260_c0_g2_i1.p2 TRINITY_DN1260_c0_g2~~TRINITY_DN1260_c0_g2_i1.p2  ORF type:complete len:181 (+),score=10.37 TRINITY_DN1260_c0_g2_i1:89-631(+)
MMSATMCAHVPDVGEEGYDELMAKIRAMPKVELHRHLEGSIRQPTIKDILQRRGDQHDDDHIAKHYHLVTPVETLAACMHSFLTIQTLFTSLEIVERLAFECVEDASKKDNTRILELRYSPGFMAGGVPPPPPLPKAYNAILFGVVGGRGGFSDRKRGGEGKRVGLGGCRLIYKKKKQAL